MIEQDNAKQKAEGKRTMKTLIIELKKEKRYRYHFV